MKALKTTVLIIASCTWGLLMTFIGAIAAWVLVIAGHRPYTANRTVVFEIGEDWGGFSLGPFAIVDREPSEYLLKHESGHGVQNIILGPFMPFVISIPSMVRYWYRELIVRWGWAKKADLSDYYGIWFEKWATNLGYKYNGDRTGKS